MKLMLQFPEGLKRLALAKAKEYEAQGHEVFISSAPCFGGCDIALEEAKAVNADKIIHFGHAEFTKVPFPIEYIEYPMEVEYKQVMEKALAELKPYARIGLLTTVQHVIMLPKIRAMLEAEGKQVFTGRGVLARHEGQILGCDTLAASTIKDKVDVFLYFGGGYFHPLGVEAGKPVLVADPFATSIKWLDAKTAESRRKGLLTRALMAKSFGVLLSTKIGQQNVEGARMAKKKLEEAGFGAEILVSNFVDFDLLENFGAFDAYINTACPRIRDDVEKARKPVLNLDDMALMLKLVRESRAKKEEKHPAPA
jgi:2-(3-amino-3-carboxypropyl)histidine synthase